MKKQKRSSLEWYDILILTIILLGKAIYNSTVYFFQQINFEQNSFLIEFTDYDNFYLLGEQFFSLIVALLYLKYRNFDFSKWTIKLSVKAFLRGIVLFIIFAFIMDIYFFLTGYFLNYEVESTPIIINNIGISTIIYAILNGIYEELFFLGICLAVKSKYIWLAFIYSIFIRLIFHTYQGIISAFGIGIILGSIIFLVYMKSKDKNLLPYFIFHIVADIIGLGIIYYFI